ncbi:MAG: hypothetical protein K8R69_01155, partial [Deltaproteobacteria bacterium]|nr:hypothetical protein [Deltaproteobacteria bacterium]
MADLRLGSRKILSLESPIGERSATEAGESARPDSNFEDLRQALGALVPALLRDASGGLDLSRIKAKSFSEFKTFLQDQAALNDGFSFRNPYETLLQNEKYAPLLKTLYRRIGGSKETSTCDADLLLKFQAELVEIDADRFVQRHFSSQEGRRKLRSYLGDARHFRKEARSELVKAIARASEQNKTAAFYQLDGVTNQISLWNYFNWFVTDEELNKAVLAAEDLLSAADYVFSEQERIAAKEKSDSSHRSLLSGEYSGRELTDEDWKKYEALAASPQKGPVGIFQNQLANLWLLTANNSNWKSEEQGSRPEGRGHILRQVEDLLRRTETIRSEKDFERLNERIQDFLNGEIQGLGHVEESVLDRTLRELWAEAKHQTIGCGLEELFEGLGAQRRSAYEDLRRSSEEYKHAMAMGEKIRLSGPSDEGLKDLSSALEATKLQLWHGYKQHKALSRGISNLAGVFGTGDIAEIRKANAFIDRTLQKLGKDGLSNDQRIQLLSELHESLQKNGLLYRAFEAAEMDGTEQLIGLAQTIVVTAGMAMATKGAGTLIQVDLTLMRTAMGARAFRMAQGFGLGMQMTTAENVLSVASGEVRQGPETVGKWFKDAVATGTSMALSGALHLNHTTKESVIKNLWARYTVNGIQGARNFLVDTGMEAIEELVDQYTRQVLEGKNEALSWQELHEIVALSLAGGGLKVGAVAEAISGGGIPASGKVRRPSTQWTQPWFQALTAPMWTMMGAGSVGPLGLLGKRSGAASLIERLKGLQQDWMKRLEGKGARLKQWPLAALLSGWGEDVLWLDRYLKEHPGEEPHLTQVILPLPNQRISAEDGEYHDLSFMETTLIALDGQIGVPFRHGEFDSLHYLFPPEILLASANAIHGTQAFELREVSHLLSLGEMRGMMSQNARPLLMVKAPQDIHGYRGVHPYLAALHDVYHWIRVSGVPSEQRTRMLDLFDALERASRRVSDQEELNFFREKLLDGHWRQIPTLEELGAAAMAEREGLVSRPPTSAIFEGLTSQLRNELYNFFHPSQFTRISREPVVISGSFFASGKMGSFGNVSWVPETEYFFEKKLGDAMPELMLRPEKVAAEAKLSEELHGHLLIEARKFVETDLGNWWRKLPRIPRLEKEKIVSSVYDRLIASARVGSRFSSMLEHSGHNIYYYQLGLHHADPHCLILSRLHGMMLNFARWGKMGLEPEWFPGFEEGEDFHEEFPLLPKHLRERDIPGTEGRLFLEISPGMFESAHGVDYQLSWKGKLLGSEIEEIVPIMTAGFRRVEDGYAIEKIQGGIYTDLEGKTAHRPIGELRVRAPSGKIKNLPGFVMSTLKARDLKVWLLETLMSDLRQEDPKAIFYFRKGSHLAWTLHKLRDPRDPGRNLRDSVSSLRGEDVLGLLRSRAGQILQARQALAKTGEGLVPEGRALKELRGEGEKVSQALKVLSGYAKTAMTLNFEEKEGPYYQLPSDGMSRHPVHIPQTQPILEELQKWLSEFRASGLLAAFVGLSTLLQSNIAEAYSAAPAIFDPADMAEWMVKAGGFLASGAASYLGWKFFSNKKKAVEARLTEAGWNQPQREAFLSLYAKKSGFLTDLNPKLLEALAELKRLDFKAENQFILLIGMLNKGSQNPISNLQNLTEILRFLERLEPPQGEMEGLLCSMLPTVGHRNFPVFEDLLKAVRGMSSWGMTWSKIVDVLEQGRGNASYSNYFLDG